MQCRSKAEQFQWKDDFVFASGRNYAGNVVRKGRCPLVPGFAGKGQKKCFFAEAAQHLNHGFLSSKIQEGPLRIRGLHQTHPDDLRTLGMHVLPLVRKIGLVDGSGLHQIYRDGHRDGVMPGKLALPLVCNTGLDRCLQWTLCTILIG